MDKYYYLISSLPLLKFSDKPPITAGDFIAESQKWLSETEFALLSKVDINNPGPDEDDTQILKTWKDFEYSIAQELSAYRSAKKKNLEYRLSKYLSDIVEGDNNPLVVEKRLLFLKWDFLEEQEAGHFFDLDFLIIYYLKLQILQRQFSFNKEKGKARFEDLSRVDLPLI
ncbi:MAG: DUF2764 family protein [Candidatus Omnitrophota bacterium]